MWLLDCVNIYTHKTLPKYIKRNGQHFNLPMIYLRICYELLIAVIIIKYDNNVTTEA